MEGLGLGSYIDDFDVIVRVNEVSNENQPEDYGSRTDIVFTGSRDDAKLDSIFADSPAGSRPVIIFPRQRFSRTGNERHGDSKRHEIINISPNLGKLSKGIVQQPKNPTTGFLAICTILEAKPLHLFIAGFTFFSSFQAYSRSNIRHKAKYGWRTFTVSGHDTMEEVLFLQTLFPRSQTSYDKKFETLIVKQKFKGRHPIVFGAQVFRNVLNGIFVRIRQGGEIEN